jgi:hypothetical protein
MRHAGQAGADAIQSNMVQRQRVVPRPTPADSGSDAQFGSQHFGSALPDVSSLNRGAPQNAILCG